ncbi:hypothetical protein AMTRI_Chr09g14490 [Amborella trichopoda]
MRIGPLSCRTLTTGGFLELLLIPRILNVSGSVYVFFLYTLCISFTIYWDFLSKVYLLHFVFLFIVNAWENESYWFSVCIVVNCFALIWSLLTAKNKKKLFDKFGFTLCALLFSLITSGYAWLIFFSFRFFRACLIGGRGQLLGFHRVAWKLQLPNFIINLHCFGSGDKPRLLRTASKAALPCPDLPCPFNKHRNDYSSAAPGSNIFL